MIKNICVIGAGVYGSYLINSLQNKYPNVKITLFEVGDSKIKSEEEIGFLSNIKKQYYKGLSDGRWFGFGGTSTKWGGQLLTFSSNEFKNPSKFLQEIIELNEKYKTEMLAKFNISNDYPEKYVSEEIFVKTGVWLSIFKRNFFEYFRIKKRKNVTIIANARVSRVESIDGKHINKIFYIKDGKEYSESFDYYFLTAGAFESARILLESQLIEENKIYFSDHLSQKVFKIKNSTKIGDDDFVFLMKGASLITKRLIGEVDDCSFYVHPVFNLELPFFQGIKSIIFEKTFSYRSFFNIFTNINQLSRFLWSVLVRRKMFVYNNEWFFYIDIENPSNASYVILSKEKDKFGLHGLDVYYKIGEDTEKIYNRVMKYVEEFLKSNNCDFEILFNKVSTEKYEDIYHPYSMFNYKTIDDYFSSYQNMIIFNTGVLPRSGGINPTGALFPVIDEFINSYFMQKL
jgi:hypothetical protein